MYGFQFEDRPCHHSCFQKVEKGQWNETKELETFQCFLSSKSFQCIWVLSKRSFYSEHNEHKLIKKNFLGQKAYIT